MYQSMLFGTQVMKERDKEITDDEAEDEEDTDKKDGDEEAKKVNVLVYIHFVMITRNRQSHMAGSK